MAMKTYTLCLGNCQGYVHPAPERTARKCDGGIFADIKFKIWPNRKAMAKAIRREEKTACLWDKTWKPLVPLTDGEGY